MGTEYDVAAVLKKRGGEWYINSGAWSIVSQPKAQSLNRCLFAKLTYPHFPLPQAYALPMLEAEAP